jgi:hypothetical protein
MKTQKFGKALSVTLLIFSSIVSISCKSSSPGDAYKFYDILKMDKALSSFKELVVKNDISSKDKADIYLKISRIFYKGYNQLDSAIFYAEKGLSVADNTQKTESLKQLTSYYLASQKYSKASEYGSILLRSSQNERDSLDVLNLILNIKIAAIENDAAKGSVQMDKLDSTIQLANTIYMHQPELPVNNEKRLELYLLKGLWAEASSALNDYYFFNDDRMITDFYKNSLYKFKSLINDISSNKLTSENKVKMVEMLGDFRFFNIALVFSKYYRVENEPETEEIVAYANFRKTFEKAVNTHYSGILINNENDKQFKQQLDSCDRYLWSKIKVCKGKPYNYNSLIDIAGRTFGMNAFGKEKGPYHVYILGEAIYHSNNNVEQYGYSAPYNYFLVDHIVGTNVRGYYYDYFEWGGWSENDLAMENRKIILEGAISNWNKIADKTTAQIDSIAHKQAIHDDSLLINTEIADLPGLRTRFELKALCYIRDSIQKAGFDGTELRKKVISQIRLNDFLSSTLAHEGRHIIDAKNGFAGKDHVQTEFTANLSSIAFAPVPQMSLSRVFIYDPESKDPTGHRKADSKIVQGFLTWMKEHKTEIQGFDASRPVLSQADKLNNAQIIAICKGIDPLGRK